jgi:hypothetical protein
MGSDFIVSFFLLRQVDYEGVTMDKNSNSGMEVHSCNSSSLEAEAGESWVLGQLRLHSKILSQTKILKVHKTLGSNLNAVI